MASTDGQTPVDLIQEIERRPYAFDFFRAVRLLECLLRSTDSTLLAPRIGTSRLPDDDLIRFGQKPSLAFASSTLDSLDLSKPPKLFVNFFGLFGTNGPMPLHFTDYAIRRELGQPANGDLEEVRLPVAAGDAGDKADESTAGKDFSLTSFCDLFHHRLISLFYRAWASTQKAVDFDRPAESRFGVYIGSLIGLGMESLQGRDAVPDWAKLYYSGRLAGQSRNAEGLEAIVQDYFEVPAEVRTFVGRWLALPYEYRCDLGKSAETGALGKTAILGSRFYDTQLGFRIRLGPMALTDVRRFLPEGQSFPRLAAWVLNYVGDEFFWDVQLIVRAEDVPDSCLGAVPEKAPGVPAQLGRTCWLKSVPAKHDAADIILSKN